MSGTNVANTGACPSLVRVLCLGLISLASCVRADPPEMFVADPSMQNDFTANLPSTGSSQGFHYEIIQGHAILEGDILLGLVNEHGDIPPRLSSRGVGKNDVFNRWPDGIVIYERPVNHTQTQRDNVEKAIAHWTEFTTLSFVERTSENASQYPHYIQFLSTQSCASHVGMIGGPQPIYISDACSIGSIIHEIGHAVGLFHEHTRADRDNFVQINLNEVVSGKSINFSKQTANVSTYSDYDYGSIMHYGERFFSKSGEPTIIVADDIEIGQRVALSPLDIDSVNKMYETDLALGTPFTNETVDGLEIGLTTYNMGLLGAHQLQLLVQLGTDSVWKGISSDSGWDCLTFDSELKCTRDTMREQTESRFTVLADPVSATSDDLSIRLLSRTQDADFTNNTFNDEGTDWQTMNEDLESLQEPSIAVAKNLTGENNDSTSTPTILAAKTATDSTVNDASAAGGGISVALLAMMALVSGIRRRGISTANR